MADGILKSVVNNAGFPKMPNAQMQNAESRSLAGQNRGQVETTIQLQPDKWALFHDLTYRCRQTIARTGSCSCQRRKDDIFSPDT